MQEPMNNNKAMINYLHLEVDEFNELPEIISVILKKEFEGGKSYFTYK